VIQIYEKVSNEEIKGTVLLGTRGVNKNIVDIPYDEIQILGIICAKTTNETTKMTGNQSSFIHSMALQSFVGPWPLFSFLNLYTVDSTPWTGDQPVARPLPIHRTTQTQN
jgi:hypothetical protein